MVWIGLNHLKDGWGWQWSDRAPLSLVNFTTGKKTKKRFQAAFSNETGSIISHLSALPASPLQDNRQCGVYNSAYEGRWQSLSCESALPYICKKTPNDTRRAEPLGETLSSTPVCRPGKRIIYEPVKNVYEGILGQILALPPPQLYNIWEVTFNLPSCCALRSESNAATAAAFM